MSEPSESGPYPAASAAADPPEERIVGGAVDLVVALPVAEPDRHVGLAEDHAARGPGAGNRQRVFARREILLRRKAPRRRQSRDVVGFLHRQGNAEQRPGLAARAGGIGGAGGIEAAFEIADAYRIDPGVVPLDAGNRVLRQLHGRDLLRRKRCR